MRILKIFIFCVCLNPVVFTYAETITLKSGQSVTGNILEKTDKYIKMDVEGVKVTYYSDEIKSNNEKSAGTGDDQDTLIRDVLESGGIKEQIDNLPSLFILSMTANCRQKNSEEACAIMKEAATQSFKADDFNKSVVDALSLNFDKDRLSTILTFFKSPLGQRITQEELSAESPQALPEKSEFAKQLVANPPSQARLALFERSDKAVHSTDLAVEISSLMALDMYEAVKRVSSSQSTDDDTSKLQMELKLRVQLRQPMKNSSRISFLFDYRHISDQELNEQINFQESETGQWFIKIINKAFVDAMAHAGKDMAARLVTLSKEKSDAIQAQFKSFTNEELYQQAEDLIDGYSGNAEDINQAWLRLSVILTRDPNFAKTYVGMARIILLSGFEGAWTYNQKAVQSAMQYIDKAIILDPNLAEAYRGGGYVEVRGGDLDKAKEMLQKAKILDHQSMGTDLLEGFIAYAEKRYNDALASDQAALTKAKTANEQFIVYKSLAYDYEETSQKDKASDTFLKIIGLKPDSAWAKGDYASYLNRAGDWDSAINWAQKAIAQKDYPAAHKILASAYYRKGYDLYWKKQNYNEGGPYFEKAYAIDPAIKGLNYSLADYYRSINRLQDAADAYRREITIDPTNQDAQQQLDRTLAASGSK